MAVYEFKCEKCGAIRDIVQPIGSATFEDRECLKCGGVAVHRITAAAVLTGGMSNASDDVKIGQAAAKRWDRIYERREERNKVREAAGKRAVQETIAGSGDSDYQFSGVESSDKKLTFVELPKPPKED